MPRTLIPTAVATLLAALVLAAVPTGAAAAKKKLRKVAVQSDAAIDAVAYGRRDDVMQFGADIAARHGLDADGMMKRATLGTIRACASASRTQSASRPWRAAMSAPNCITSSRRP